MARITLLLVFMISAHSLSAQSSAELEKFAQSAEKSKQYEEAGMRYVKAADAYKAEADQAIASHTLSDRTVYNLMISSRDCYNRAAENYKHVKGKIIEQTDATKASIAMALRALAWAKEKKLDVLPKVDPPKPPVVPEAKQVPWKPGKEIILATTKIHFAMTMPDALKYNGPIAHNHSNDQMLKSGESTVFVVGLNTPPRMMFTFREYAGDVNKNGNPTTADCERDAQALEAYNKNMATNPYKVIMAKDQEIKLMNIGDNTKACLKTKVTQQMDTKHFMFGFDLMFEYKGNSYWMNGIAPIEWRTCTEEMLKTFHITGQQPEPEDDLRCFGNDFLEVPGLAFEDTWMLPDPKGTLRITLSPNVKRNEVPYAWHDIINATRKAVAKIEELSAKFEEVEERDGKEMDVLEFVVNYYEIPQISPGQLADAYLEVFDKMITAISGLEGTISKMSVDISYELPYTSVKTKCIPRFKCVNEKWTPDYSDMSFEIISENKLPDKHSWYHLSPGQVKDKLAEINKIPETMKANAQKVASGECGQHRHKLMNLKWPPNPKQCERLEKKIVLFKEQLKNYTDEKAALAKELKDYGNSKSKNIDNTKTALAKNAAQLKIEVAKLAAAQAKKAGYIANQASMEKVLFDKLMKAVNEEIAKLESLIEGLNLEKAELTERLQMLQSDKFEQINYQRTQFVEGEIKRLNNEIDIASKQLSDCREKEKVFKKN